MNRGDKCGVDYILEQVNLEENKGARELEESYNCDSDVRKNQLLANAWRWHIAGALGRGDRTGITIFQVLPWAPFTPFTKD